MAEGGKVNSKLKLSAIGNKIVCRKIECQLTNKITSDTIQT